jgi:hypothetical protein
VDERPRRAGRSHVRHIVVECLVTVTAADAAGNTASTTLTVTSKAMGKK